MANLSVLGEAALEYAAQGWRVFPLSPGGKIPLGGNGVHDATTDSAQITEWWTKTANANIGFATGAGIHVVDIDGEEGEESLVLLETENGPLAPTRECRTGRGRHFYFNYVGGELGNSASKLGSKVDTRGDGGYVILPPSVHQSGALYQWANDLPLAELPRWIADPLEKRAYEFKPAEAWAPPADDEFRLVDKGRKDEHSYGPMHPYVSAFFPHECHELARMSQGSRNHKLNELAFLAGRIVNAGYANSAFIENMVMDAALACGLGSKEAEKTWNSGYQSGWMVEPFSIEEERGYTSKSKEVYEEFKGFKEKREPRPSSLVITPLSKVKRDHIEYMWGYRLVRQGVNLLIGDGGLGKSALSLHIARSVTDGVPLPDDQGQMVRGSVMMATYEDPPDLVKMRARVLGIDLDKFFVLEGYKDEDGRLMNFGQDQVVDLMAAMDDPMLADTRLLIIDPWGRYLDDDDHKEKLIRRAIAPLERLAQERNVTILILGHTNKSKDYTQAEHRIAGHSAFKNVARSVIMVGEVKSDTMAIAHVKHNWSSPAPAVLYTWDENKSWGNNESPLEWGEVIKLDADDLFAPKIQSAKDKAAAWLRRELISGPVPLDDLKEACEDEKIKWSTVEKAAQDLGIHSKRKGNQWSGGMTTVWSLSEIEDDEPSSEAGRPTESVGSPSTRSDGDSGTPSASEDHPVPAPLPVKSISDYYGGFGDEGVEYEIF